jgi:phage-related protein
MFTDLATEMGQKLIPAIKPLLEAAGELARSLLPLVIAAFDKLIPFVQKAADFIKNLVSQTIAGEGPLVSIGEKIVSIKDAVMEFLEPIIKWIKENVTLKDVLTALAIVLGGIVLAAIVAIAQAIGPVILVITGLIAGVVLVRKAWEALQPAMEKIRAFFTDKVFPVFKMLMDVYLFPIRLAFEGLKITINNVLEAVRRLTLGLIDIDVPDWLKPGSPTPFEMGLRGIRDEMQDLYRGDLPALNAQMQGLQQTTNRNKTVNQTTNIYTSRVDTRGESQAAVRFALGGI